MLRVEHNASLKTYRYLNQRTYLKLFFFLTLPLTVQILHGDFFLSFNLNIFIIFIQMVHYQHCLRHFVKEMD